MVGDDPPRLLDVDPILRLEVERAAVEVHGARKLLHQLLGNGVLVGAQSVAVPRPLERDGELGAELLAQPRRGLQEQADHLLGLVSIPFQLGDLARAGLDDEPL
eukprot:812345-Pyramimonas_sp.AAC.1